MVPVTNLVHVVTTDAGGVTTTNIAPVVRLVTNDVFEVAAPVAGYVHTAQGIGSTISTLAPPAAPFVSAIDAILGIALAALGLFARIKTNLARKNADALDKTTDMLTAVVSGVEVAGTADVKTAIAQHASVIGVTHALDTVVQTVTANLPARKT